MVAEIGPGAHAQALPTYTDFVTYCHHERMIKYQYRQFTYHYIVRLTIQFEMYPTKDVNYQYLFFIIKIENCPNLKPENYSKPIYNELL